MNRKSTLFSKTLRGKPEDAITEVLAELLRAPDVGEQVLQAILPQADSRPDEVLTQWRVDGGGRPDLLLRWPDRTVAFESKFWAPLQPEQKQGYQTALAQEIQPATLYFVAPAARVATIRSEIDKTVPPPGFVTWEDIHDKLSEIRAETDHGRVWLREVMAAIEQEAALAYQPVQFKQDDLERLCTPASGLTVANCLYLVDTIRNQLENRNKSDGFLPRTRSSTTHSEEFAYGFNVKTLAEEINAWIGVWIIPWKQNGNLLGVQFWQGDGTGPPPALQGLTGALTGPYWRWAPLALSTAAPQELVADLLDQLDRIYQEARK